MALTPPTHVDISAFTGEAYPTDEQTRLDELAIQATDALWMYTGLESYPSDERHARIVKYAIMELTLWLKAQAENREEINSPFSSERIGSYSYSKMNQARTGASGLFWLDSLFRLLYNVGDTAVSGVVSENVFNPGWNTYEELETLEEFRRHDPTVDGWHGWVG